MVRTCRRHIAAAPGRLVCSGPISSNLTRAQGIDGLLAGIVGRQPAPPDLVAVGSTCAIDGVRQTIVPRTRADVLSFKSLPDFSLNMALILPTIGPLAAEIERKSCPG